MALAPGVLWLTTIGWGLPFILYLKDGVPLQALQPCQKNGHNIHIIKHESKNLN